MGLVYSKIPIPHEQALARGKAAIVFFNTHTKSWNV